MSMKLEDLIRIRDTMKEEVQQAQGAKRAILEELNTLFGIETPEQALAEKARLEKELEGLQQKYDDLLAEFEKQYGDRLK
jgi:predicted nuclease with TOPRIM domain